MNLLRRRDARRDDFRTQHPLEQRKQLSARILRTYPDRLPIIALPVRGGVRASTPKLAKQKFLVPIDFTGQMFLRELRRLMVDLEAQQAVYMFVGKNALVPTSLLMVQIYDRFKDEDGFLYVHYSVENTFG